MLANALASLDWIEAALIIFVVVFLIVTVRACTRRRGAFDDAARLPLSDEPGAPALTSEEIR